MKKISMLLVTIAMVLTMAQCKKNEATDQNKTVTITLDVKSNNGAKVNVNPAIGTVDFETGDKVYVSSGGKYIGFLTHNGTNFVGNITNPIENQPLQFYFLGNVTPQETLSAGTTEECSVIISDQTEHLPVISCAASNENYVSGVTAYSAHLLNKCALVKFNVTTPSNSPICITGMKNKVTVDFTQNTMIPNQDGDGVIMLPAGSGENVEKWAILLPQEALEEGEEGSVYSEDGTYSGIRPIVPTIVENGYLASGITVMVKMQTVSGVPTGAINGLFTINANGDQVYFSQGNLQYIGSAATPYWKFAENQWGYLGITTNQNSSDKNVDRDLFGWGTSGYNHGAVCYQPWSTSTNLDDYFAYNHDTYNLYDQTGQADWGYNAISNGDNMENNGWRTLTNNEWTFICYTRVNAALKRGHGYVNGIKGVILIPDEWTLPDGLDFISGNSSWANVYSAEQWGQMETNGAVFLPASGCRDGEYVGGVGSNGYYWSSSSSNAAYAYNLLILDSTLGTLNSSCRDGGYSVRLVKDYNP